MTFGGDLEEEWGDDEWTLGEFYDNLGVSYNPYDLSSLYSSLKDGNIDSEYILDFLINSEEGGAKHLAEYKEAFNWSNTFFENLNNSIYLSAKGKGYDGTVFSDAESGGGGIGVSDITTGVAFIASGAEIQLSRELRPFRPIRYNNGSLLREGTIAKNVTSGGLMTGSRYLQATRGALYWTGAAAGVYGMGLSTFNYWNGDISGTKYASDMFFGVVGFAGPVGLMVSTTYFIATSPGFQEASRTYHARKAEAFGPGGGFENLNSDFFYSGGLCFTEGTKIAMGDGTLRAIETVIVGDTILTYDFINKKIIKTEVLKTDTPMHDNLIQISFSNKTINTNTQDHPYFVIGKGWCSFNPVQSHERYDLKTSKLEIGDKCYVCKGKKMRKVKVISIIPQIGLVRTYNLTGLKVGNSYFANGVLVNTENPKQNSTIDKSNIKSNKD